MIFTEEHQIINYVPYKEGDTKRDYLRDMCNFFTNNGVPQEYVKRIPYYLYGIADRGFYYHLVLPTNTKDVFASWNNHTDNTDDYLKMGVYQPVCYDDVTKPIRSCKDEILYFGPYVLSPVFISPKHGMIYYNYRTFTCGTIHGTFTKDEDVLYLVNLQNSEKHNGDFEAAIMLFEEIASRDNKHLVIMAIYNDKLLSHFLRMGYKQCFVFGATSCVKLCDHGNIPGYIKFKEE